MNQVTESLHFADAYAVLAQQLGSAHQQVVCALAGPCGRPVFDLLLGCRRRGLALTLVVSGAAQDLAPGIAWERLKALGATLLWLAPGAPRLHTSVCLVDGAAVLTGDLAPLSPVPAPHAGGVLLQINPELAAQCAQGLSALALAHAPTQEAAPAAPADAQGAPSTGAELAPYDDPQQWAPAWQTELLQAHALALQADIAEMHRTINAFDLAQDAAIGPLLRDCLDAKRQHLQQLHAQSGSDADRAQAEAAQERFEQYTQAQDAKPAPPPALEPEAQAQMKQLYRKLAMRLHPDRVEEDDKAEAQTLFQRLQTSYEGNDFAALQALEQQLVAPLAHHTPGAKAQPFSGKRSPAQLAAALKERLAQHQRERMALVHSATWQTISTQSNWGLWFKQQASYLQAELHRYAHALGASQDANAKTDIAHPGTAHTKPTGWTEWTADHAHAAPVPAADLAQPATAA